MYKASLMDGQKPPGPPPAPLQERAFQLVAIHRGVVPAARAQGRSPRGMHLAVRAFLDRAETGHRRDLSELGLR